MRPLQNGTSFVLYQLPLSFAFFRPFCPFPLVLSSVYILSFSSLPYFLLFYFFFFSPPCTTLFIISRHKLHLATVQLFPFISSVMHRRHEIDINSGSEPLSPLTIPEPLSSPSSQTSFYSLASPYIPLWCVICRVWDACVTTNELLRQRRRNPAEIFTKDRFTCYSFAKCFINTV